MLPAARISILFIPHHPSLPTATFAWPSSHTTSSLPVASFPVALHLLPRGSEVPTRITKELSEELAKSICY